ncbi:MAG: Omp28-related outer membrane protein [Bacteroidota bacterium]
MRTVFSLGLLTAATVFITFSSCKPANTVKKVTGVTLSETTKTIVIGEEFILTATVAPADATDKAVIWTTDDFGVATVEGGKVTGIAEGEATITVTTNDGGQTDSCKIKVNKREPVSRNAILIEEFTGDRCGNCPSGSAAIHKTMKELEEQSKAFIVYHHVGFTEDKFTIAASRPLKFFYGSPQTGAPACMVNRAILNAEEVVIHPAKVTKAMLNKQLAELTYVILDMNVSYTEGSRELKVDVSGELLTELPNAKLNVYLVQDSIIAYQASGGDKYPHRNVVRAALASSVWGDGLGVVQGKYSKSYTYKIPESIAGVQNKPIPTDIKKMYVVAFVADVNNVKDYKQVGNNKIHNVAFKKIQ